MNVKVLEGQDGDLETAAAVLTPLEIWGYGVLFVTIINLSSLTGIVFFPLMNKSFYKVAMQCMIGLAIGSLSGSAIFHLIPQAFHLTHTPKGNYIFVASFIWISIWIVMILECTIKIIVKTRSNSRQKRRKLRQETGAASRQPSSDAVNNILIENGHTKKVDNSEEVVETSLISGNDSEELEPEWRPVTSPKLNMNYFTLDDVHRSTLSLNHVLDKMDGVLDDDSSDKSIKTVAWIVIIGDSLHNFIDGVSIGAGFSQSFSTGLILSLAVACDEFPHELGDFAILINSGLSVRRAILFNFFSAITCYLGLALGILLGKIEFENYIFALAAGIFLYVSLADMVPEVAEAVDKAIEISPRKAWLVLLYHNIGILLGITILFILAMYSPE